MTLILLPVDLNTKPRRSRAMRNAADARRRQRTENTANHKRDAVLSNALRAKDLI